MATIHGKAGQYAKSKAMELYGRVRFIIILCCMSCGTIFGFVIASTGRLWVMVGWLVVLALSYPLTMKALDKSISKVNRERIKFLRGGQTEALIAWLLQDLDDKWHIFNGLQLEQSWDIDHIVVGPKGLFCISTKGSRGLYARGLDGRQIQRV